MIDKNADPTTKAIFDVLAERQRHRAQTDLANLFRNILRMNPQAKIEYPEYIGVFKKLEASDMGRLVRGRGKNPDRFIWKYNLKDLANKVKMNGISKLTTKQLELTTDAKIENPPKRRKTLKVERLTGRRIGVRDRNLKATEAKPEAITASQPDSVTINVSLAGMSQADRLAIIQLLKNGK